MDGKKLHDESEVLEPVREMRFIRMNFEYDTCDLERGSTCAELSDM